MYFLSLFCTEPIFSLAIQTSYKTSVALLTFLGFVPASASKGWQLKLFWVSSTNEPDYSTDFANEKEKKNSSICLLIKLK